MNDTTLIERSRRRPRAAAFGALARSLVTVPLPLEIKWPSGKVQYIENPGRNRIVELREPEEHDHGAVI